MTISLDLASILLPLSGLVTFPQLLSGGSMEGFRNEDRGSGLLCSSSVMSGWLA